MHVLEGIIQGSPQWLAIRAEHFTASEAPAMLGVSKYQTRSDLLKQKATGIASDVDGATQRLFDRGHASEALARPHAEDLAGDDLFPVTATLEIDGLKLLASLDGATMAEDVIWEHKLYSEALADDVRAGTLSQHYTAQMDQQLLVSGASKCLFMTSDGTPDRMAWCWYESTPEKQAALVAGWKQFAADLAAYTPPEVAAEVVAAPVESLPVVSVRMEGSIAVISNLTLFGEKLKAFVEKIDRDPSTDQAFADAEAAIKTLQTAQDALEQVEAAALAQTSSIEEMRRTVADYANLARTTRLALQNVVKARKEQIKVEIVAEGRDALAAHIAALNQRLGKPYMPAVPADFAGAIKGKKTVSSLRDAMGNELARAKIEASAIADRIQINLGTLRELAADHAFLFADTPSIVLKAADDLTMLVKGRIAEHQAAEAKRLEAERERIRAEEAARLEREAKAKAEAEERQRADEAAQAELAAAKNSPEGAELSPAAQAIYETEGAARFASAHKGVAKAFAAPAPRQIHPASQALRNEQPTLTLGAMKDRLGFALTADFLTELGFEATPVKAARLYRESEFGDICAALVRHIESVRADVAVAA